MKIFLLLLLTFQTVIISADSLIAEWRKRLENNEKNARDAVAIFELALSQQYQLEAGEAPVHASSKDIGVCSNCQEFLPILAEKIDNNPNMYDSVVEFAKWICIAKQLYPSERACIGTVETLKQVFREAILPTSKTAPQTMCTTLTGLDCGKDDNPTDNWWKISLPPQTRRRFEKQIQRNSETFTILHVSDAHLDLQYSVGSPAACTERLCCRYDSPSESPDAKRAGPFGAYKCDTASSTLKLMLDHVVENHNVDAVYYTGDSTTHDDWYQTRDGYLATIGAVDRIFKKAFKTTPVFMVIGNHDTVPPNNFPNPVQSSTSNMTWLYDFLADDWVTGYHWLPTSSSTDLRRAGIYNAQMKPGLRIIGLNNMGCEPKNWWLFVNSTDPDGVLATLVEWLTEAEAKSDKVHLIMHIDPGATGRCLWVWSWNYYNIVNRFKDTIAAQFSGHSHETYFMVYYDDVEFTTPVSTLHIGPSIVPFTDNNPAYRLVTVDSKTFELVDFEIYYVDLAASNQQDQFVVDKLFSAKSTFGLRDFSPASWHDLAVRFQADDQLFQLYYQYSARLAKNETCSENCKRQALCKIHTSRANDPAMCDRFVPSPLPNDGKIPLDSPPSPVTLIFLTILRYLFQ